MNRRRKFRQNGDRHRDDNKRKHQVNFFDESHSAFLSQMSKLKEENVFP